MCIVYPLLYLQSVPGSTCLSADPRQFVLLQLIVKVFNVLCFYCVTYQMIDSSQWLSPVYNTQMLRQSFYLQMQMQDQQSLHALRSSGVTHLQYDNTTKLTRSAEKTLTNGPLTYSTSIQHIQSIGNPECDQSRPFSININMADNVGIISPLSCGKKRKWR